MKNAERNYSALGMLEYQHLRRFAAIMETFVQHIRRNDEALH